MTIEQYKDNYEKFKLSRLGLYDNFDNQNGYQCFDLVNRYVYHVLTLGWVLNRLYDYLDLQGKFKEVSTTNMLPGDICIWQGEHICIFDHWDGTKLWYLTQDSIDGTSRRPTGVYWDVTNSNKPMKAFRPLYVEDAPKPEPIKPILIQHTVKPGEWLSKIATMFEVTWQDIYEINKDIIGSNPHIIQPGMILNIPIKEPIIEDLKIGDKVVFSKDWFIYTSSTGNVPVYAKYNGGTIVKIYPGTKNPYLLDSGKGFVRKEHIKKL